MDARKPKWIHRKIMSGPTLAKVERVLGEENLNTVCVGARCPNRGECYSSGTATFMIMGDTCSRDCRFCAVPSGGLRGLDPGEPAAVARAALRLGLKHVVVTSVTRDDLPDGGASHFARTIRATRGACDATVEVLVPDFRGDPGAVRVVTRENPDVFNHNIETVESLYPRVRPEAGYQRSLDVLQMASRAGMVTKSGFMAGLGESEGEVLEMLGDLLEAGCMMLTCGQYLQPEGGCIAVSEYREPSWFEWVAKEALRMGFVAVSSGPLVRSSYRAEEMLKAARSCMIGSLRTQEKRETARR